ncbi:MAG: branched-chain amino acid ABC transporter permease [Nitrospirae bacterium]|nr:branched-chain amino acid ABC transporter permease [Nitrospirota bacterium]
MNALFAAFRTNPMLKGAFTGFWTGILILPFAGPRTSFMVFLVVLFCVAVLAVYKKKSFSSSRCSIFSEKYRYLLSIISSDLRIKAFLYIITASAVLFPLMLTSYYLDIFIMAGIYMLLALGLNVIVGLTGQLHLGFAGSYAIGAYTYALLNTYFGLSFWLCLPVSALSASFAGILLSMPAIRLRGDYLAIVTLGFGEITRIVLNNWDSVTRGPNGISGIAAPSVAGISLSGLRRYYYLVMALVVLAVFITKRVEQSRTGRAWMAIREDEIAASSMGINTTKYKIYAFVFGSLWAGVAGQLFAAKMQFVSPESFTFIESVFILCMVILGGLGNTYGVLIGAFIIAILPEALRGIESYRMLIVGLGLVVMMIFRPQGIIGNMKKCRY